MLVSVMVPVYNVARYLPFCLESVLTQEGVDFEVVVGDDGSDDDFESADAPYAERVTCVRGPHRGLAQASNIAIANSRGDAIACVDADDLLLPGSLATRAACWKRCPRWASSSPRHCW